MQSSLENFHAYQKAKELFDRVVEDLTPLNDIPMCWKLISQQIASADSIAANIEEGFGRETPKDYRHFLVMARGSARETRGRYERFKHWLPVETIEDRLAHCDHIIGILTNVINGMKP